MVKLGRCPAAYTFSTGAGINFIQVNSTQQDSASTATITYNLAQTAGDLNVVVVGWNDTSATIKSVTDIGREHLHSGSSPLPKELHSPRRFTMPRTSTLHATQHSYCHIQSMGQRHSWMSAYWNTAGLTLSIRWMQPGVLPEAEPPWTAAPLPTTSAGDLFLGASTVGEYHRRSRCWLRDRDPYSVRR